MLDLIHLKDTMYTGICTSECKCGINVEKLTKEK